MDEGRCKHCRNYIRKINFVLGPTWMHVNRDTSFPTQMNGGMWEFCKIQVAEPEENDESDDRSSLRQH